jgi:hypothetical protein
MNKRERQSENELRPRFRISEFDANKTVARFRHSLKISSERILTEDGMQIDWIFKEANDDSLSDESSDLNSYGTE